MMLILYLPFVNLYILVQIPNVPQRRRRAIKILCTTKIAKYVNQINQTKHYLKYVERPEWNKQYHKKSMSAAI